MLLELSIENLALFERARLELGPGLTVVTGETGAGKSLLIGALELLLGQRPRTASVRKGAEEALVEGRFVLAGEAGADPALRALLAESLPSVLEAWDAQPAGEERELVLSRGLAREGRSRAWIDHRPVGQRLLRDVAALLVEVHGQNDHQRLFQPDEQLALLDAFGGLAARREAYVRAREGWRELVERRLGFETRRAERRDRAELLRFQAAELAAARLVPGEAEELARERAVQRHAAELGSELGRLVAELGEGEGALVERLGRARMALERWEGRIEALAPAAADLRDAHLHLEQALAAAARFHEGLAFSPARLEQIEARLYELEELQRRYRTDAAGLVARKRAIDAELAELAQEDGGLDELDAASAEARAALEQEAAALTRERRALCPRLCKAVLASLAGLGLERARFDVRIEPRVPGAGPADGAREPNADPVKARVLAELERFGPNGADRVELLLCANPGEDLRPLRAVASGGEAARIMLALHTALGVRPGRHGERHGAGHAGPTLVFDEIDAGVGGRLGPAVGEHLRCLAQRHQVLCVTHLPAIAAAAGEHFKVEKRSSERRTLTSVRRLAESERVEEVADMIAGGAAHETARAEARRLLAGSPPPPAGAEPTSAPRGRTPRRIP